jgi:hypothetical protein
VLYVLDGWHFPLMAFIQQNNVYSKRMRPVIIVNVSHGATGYMALRARDFTPTRTSRARSRALILTFDTSRLPSPRNWAMAGASNGYRAAVVRRQLTPGPTSSLPGTARLPPFICFSTSYPELGSVVCDSHSS